MSLARQLLEMFDSVKDLRKNYKAIVLDAIDWVDEEIGNGINYSGRELWDEIDLPSDFEVYVDGGFIYLAKNVKGQGYPDYDDVVEKASKDSGIELDRIKSYVTPEFLDQLHYDDMRFELDDFTKDFDLVRVGRSGGYIAVEVDKYWLVSHEKRVKDSLSKMIKKHISKFDKDYDLEDYHNIEDVGREYAEMFKDKELDDSFGYYVKIKSDKYKALEKVSKDIDKEIKYWEKPDRWVEAIIANEYWN